MRILFVGDVVGAPGRRALKPALRALAATWAPDIVIVNAENAAGGAGLTPATADEIFRAGADVLTTGNHVWDKKEIVPYIETHARVLRPLNYPPPCPGTGICVLKARNGAPVAVVNLMGRVFMADLDDPFRAADAALAELEGKARTIVVDFHAEATSEKVAMGWHLDGRVTAMVGTHTHVATADARVLPRGTAYITDVGMTGPHDSVIGVQKEVVLARFRTQRSASFTTAEGDVRLCGVVIESGPDGRATSIERVEVPFGAAGPA
jgi:metallophosphoesterase (TIGR00282 family)